jgi:hypothetical protein
MRRVHDGQVSFPLAQLNAAATADLDILSQYDRDNLNGAEFATQLNKLLTAYYAYLGRCVFKIKGSGFWRFHSVELARIGYTLDRRRVFIGAIPSESFPKASNVCRNANARLCVEITMETDTFAHGRLLR